MSESSWFVQTLNALHRFRWLVVIAVIAVCAALALPIIQSRRLEERDDGLCGEKVHVLALALNGYKDTYGCLPPPFISDQFGKPLYSWRVLITASHLDLNEFDYTKPWDDPVNLQVANSGHNEWTLKNMFSCPSINHAKRGQTDYFYVLNGEERWPRDFFLDEDSRPKILVVESQWREVFWSEPVDFVYETPKGAIAWPGYGFLNKLREIKPVHSSGYQCRTSDCVSIKIPHGTAKNLDGLIASTFFRQRAKEKAGAEKERVDQLVAKLMKALGDPPKHVAREPLLLLSELGPQAAAAVPIIRRIRDEGDKSIRPIAAMALARIEK